MFHHAWNLYRLFWLHNGNVAFIAHVGAGFVLGLFLFSRWKHRPRLYDRRTRLERGDYYERNRNHPEDDNGTT